MLSDWRRRAALLFALAVAAVIILAPRGSRAAGFAIAPQFQGAVAGQTLEFSASGFAPGEIVSVWATAPDGSVLGAPRVGASDTGDARLWFALPLNAVGGNWAITAYGHQTQTPVIIRFDVIGRAPPVVPVQGFVSPEAGPLGATFSFTALGYRADEKVSYWITGPGNVVYEAFPEGAQASWDGVVRVSWSPPAGSPPGIFVLTAQGLKSGVARGIAFSVQ